MSTAPAVGRKSALCERPQDLDRHVELEAVGDEYGNSKLYFHEQEQPV